MSKMKIVKIVISVLLISTLAITGIRIAPVISIFMAKRSVTQQLGKKQDGDIGGAFRGMYHIYSFKPKDEENEKAREDAVEESNKHPEEKLALAEFNIVNYRDGDISETGLSEIASYMDTLISTGKGLIVRFVYDWNGNASGREPDDIKIMLRHIEQIAPIVNERKQDIIIIQGSLAGAYGEMHGSKHSKDKSTKKLIKKLHKCIDPEIYLAVRTPRVYRRLSGIAHTSDVSEISYKEGKLRDHISLYNDGMLGSKSDTGTYGSKRLKSSKDGNIAAVRKDEIAFQKALCDLVPNGGEVINDNPYNDIPAAITDLSKMHVTYLNSEYDEAVIKKWKNTPYPEAVDAYESAYDYITAFMGYRYYISKAKLAVVKYPKKNDSLGITITNDGFAPYYRDVEMILIVKGEDNFYKEIRKTTDMTAMSNGESRTFKFKLMKEEYDKGEYDIRLTIKDAMSGRLIPLANDTVDEQGFYSVGHMVVE